MAKEIKLNLTGDSVFDIAEELRFIADRIEDYKVIGYPKAPGIFMGHWKIEDVCDTCYGTGIISVDENDGEGHIQQGVGQKSCPDCGKKR